LWFNLADGNQDSLVPPHTVGSGGEWTESKTHRLRQFNKTTKNRIIIINNMENK